MARTRKQTNLPCWSVLRESNLSDHDTEIIGYYDSELIACSIVGTLELHDKREGLEGAYKYSVHYSGDEFVYVDRRPGPV